MIPAKRALVFDDDELCRELMIEILSNQDLEVMDFCDPTFFETCVTAERCPEESPCAALIFTDNQMPAMTGLDLLENLQQKSCKIPDEHKAVISGSLSAEDLERARQLGCKVFFKPFNPETIWGWLDSLSLGREPCEAKFSDPRSA